MLLLQSLALASNYCSCHEGKQMGLYLLMQTKDRWFESFGKEVFTITFMQNCKHVLTSLNQSLGSNWPQPSSGCLQQESGTFCSFGHALMLYQSVKLFTPQHCSCYFKKNMQKKSNCKEEPGVGLCQHYLCNDWAAKNKYINKTTELWSILNMLNSAIFR